MYFFLDRKDYTWANALLWGNCRLHFQKAQQAKLEGRLGDRVVHLLICFAEVLPIVSQIASIFEKIIGICFQPHRLAEVSPSVSPYLSDSDEEEDLFSPPPSPLSAPRHFVPRLILGFPFLMFVRHFNGETYAVNINSAMTVGELKAQIVEKSGIPFPSEGFLMYNNHPFKDDSELLRSQQLHSEGTFIPAMSL